MVFGRRSVEQEISERFICTKCRSHGADVRSLTMTGAGLSRILDFQRHEYIFASCLQCGYTEVFNTDILDSTRSRGMDILDVIFGN